MESIEYRGMEMTVLQTLSWDREAMLDPSHTTYLDTRWRCSFVVTYNPAAASFKANANPAIFPEPFPGQMPALTDVAIRRYLEQPRGTLVVRSANTEVLRSPQRLANGVSLPCDTRNGPFLKVNSISEIPGERLWQIHLEFETYINENPLGKRSTVSSLPVILSNRWYAIDDTNWQHLRTRKYQGLCTVRADTLRATGRNAADMLIDSFRSEFAPFSVPPGFQRDQVHVTVTPDGNSAHYLVVDTEQLFNKSQNCPAIRIQVSDSSWMWTGTAIRALGQAGGVVGIGARGAAFLAYGTSAVASGGLNPSGTAMIALGLQTMEMVEGAIRSNLPKGYKNVVVRVWGNQRTPRSTLRDYGLAVATTRITGGAPAALFTSSKEILVSQDSDNFVQISTTVNWGLDTPAGAFGSIGAIGFGIAAFIDAAIDPAGNVAQAVFDRTIATTSTTNAGGFTHTQNVIVNPAFPTSSGTRGTAGLPPSNVNLQTLLTQTLEGFDQQPAAVP